MPGLTKITPRHLEIARRLVYEGANQRQIAEDMGISQSRLSIIINSPLFRLELQRLQRQKERETAEAFAARIQEKLATTTERALDVHNAILSSSDLPLQIQQRSATDVISLYLKSIKSSPLAPEDVLDVPYEQRLREVIYREVETSPNKRISKSRNPDHGEKEIEPLTSSTIEELYSDEDEREET